MIIDISASCINNNDFWKQKGGRTFASLLLALDCDSGADEVKTAVCRVVLHAAGLEWTYCLNGKPCDLLTTPIHASKQESGFIPTQCLLSFCYNGLSDGFLGIVSIRDEWVPLLNLKKKQIQMRAILKQMTVKIQAARQQEAWIYLISQRRHFHLSYLSQLNQFRKYRAIMECTECMDMLHSSRNRK